MDIKAHKPLYDLIRQAHLKTIGKVIEIKEQTGHSSESLGTESLRPKSDFGFDFLLFLYC